MHRKIDICFINEDLDPASTSNARIPAVHTSCSLGATPESHWQSPGNLWHFLDCRTFPSSQNEPLTIHFQTCLLRNNQANFKPIMKIQTTKASRLTVQTYNLDLLYLDLQGVRGRGNNTGSLKIQAYFCSGTFLTSQTFAFLGQAKYSAFPLRRFFLLRCQLSTPFFPHDLKGVSCLHLNKSVRISLILNNRTRQSPCLHSANIYGAAATMHQIL